MTWDSWRRKVTARRLAEQVLYLGVPAGILGFWAGMFMAAYNYPSEYDWRYITISSLVYPERNPHGHLWASAGIGLCGLAGLCWSAVLILGGARASSAGTLVEGATQFQNASTGRHPLGVWALGLGYLCMLCCALLPQGVFRIPRTHEVLALTAFLGICIGMVSSTLVALTERVQPKERCGNTQPGNSQPRALRLMSRRPEAVLLAGVALSPIVLAALVQAYVSYARPELHWVSLEWRARGVAPYLSFALWEWLACAVFSLYMVLLSRSTGHALMLESERPLRRRS